MFRAAGYVAFAVAVWARTLYSRGRGNGPDYVYTFGTYDLVVGAVLKMLGVCWIVDVLDIPELHLEDVQKDWVAGRFVKAIALCCYVGLARILVSRADLAVVAAPDESSGFAKVLRDEYHVPLARLLAIPNGIDASLIVTGSLAFPEPSTDAGLPLRLVYAGGLSEHHGTLFLLDALSIAKKSTPVHLILVGSASPEFSRILRARVVELALECEVEWLGPLPHSGALAAIDGADAGLYAFPQRCWHDGAIPIKVGEYMARGKPVLAADLTGARHFVRHGETGLLLPPGDAPAWAAAFVRLAEDRELLHHMAGAAFAAAPAHGWPGINRRLLARIDELAAQEVPKVARGSGWDDRGPHDVEELPGLNSGRPAHVLSRASARLSMLRRPDRWDVYEDSLRVALAADYAVVPLELWLACPGAFPSRTLILRHDVDADPVSASRMAQVENSLGLTSTWYFRWTTFDLRVIDLLLQAGHQVGLHYETLTRVARQLGLLNPEAITDGVLGTCRHTLKEEVACFTLLVGSCRSICSHGDARAHLIGHANSVLLDEQDLSEFGVLYSADDPLALQQVHCWVADGAGMPAYWTRGLTLVDAVRTGHDVILFNTHPHHWRTGAPVAAKRGATRLSSMMRYGNRWEGAQQTSAWLRHRSECFRRPGDQGR